MTQCLEGNQDAWKTLVARYKNLVYSIPVKYHLTPEDAGDVFQEVWLNLYQELKNLREASALRYWLATTAARKCQRVKAQRARQDQLDEERAGLDELEASVAQSLRDQACREAVASLPPRCQTLVRLLFFEHPALPYKEIAARLELAEGSIGFIRGRCLKKLQKALEERGF